MARRQGQRAGDDAVQIQVAGNYVVGVSEERAKEIADRSAVEAIERYSTEAQEIGRGRIATFDEALISLLSEHDRLDALADPAIQVLLRRAQLGAASTEREDDYDLLARLIKERIESGGDRAARAGIQRAVEIIDQLDERALAGLTALQLVQQLKPVTGLIMQGIISFDKALSILDPDRLPQSDGWLDHLDILDCVRISSLGNLKKFKDYFGEKVMGYVATGVQPGSQQEEEAQGSCTVATTTVARVEHELRPGWFRLPFVSRDAYEQQVDASPRAPEAREHLMHVADLYGLGQSDPGTLDALMAKVDQLPVLGPIRQWWDGIPVAVQITATGRAVAVANAMRLDSGGVLPKLV